MTGLLEITVHVIDKRWLLTELELTFWDRDSNFVFSNFTINCQNDVKFANYYSEVWS